MLGVGCGNSEDINGEEFFSGTASAELGSATNQARCSTCHSVDPSERGGSGDALGDIAYRSSFKGGGAPTLLDATNACVTGWMGGTALTSSDEEWIALRGFLESVSNPSVTAPNTLAPEVLENEAAYEAAYAGGDATRGEATYGRYCARCHDNALVVSAVPSWPRATLASFSVGRIAQKVRTAGPPPSGTADPSDSTPGPMPFFEPDELSADDLKDIIAFVRTRS